MAYIKREKVNKGNLNKRGRMIDQHLRTTYQKFCLDPLVPYFKRFHPITITLLACLVGLSSFPLILFGHFSLAIIALFISGFLDTLDGTLARYLKKESPQGAVLD